MTLEKIQEEINLEKTNNPKKDEKMTEILLLKLILDELRIMNKARV
jgi:hypothetical protein